MKMTFIADSFCKEKKEAYIPMYYEPYFSTRPQSSINSIIEAIYLCMNPVGA